MAHVQISAARRRSPARSRACVLAPLLSGCVLTTDTCPPAPVSTCRRIIARLRGKPRAALPAPDWWRGFRSGELTALVERAYLDNLDIAAAVARIEQADARRASRARRCCRCIGFDLSASPLGHRRRPRQSTLQRRAQRQLRDRLLGQEPRGAALRRIHLDRQPLRSRGDRPLHRRERHQHVFPGPRRAGPAAHRARQRERGDPHPDGLSGPHRRRHRERPRYRAAAIAGGTAARRDPAARSAIAPEHRDARCAAWRAALAPDRARRQPVRRSRRSVRRPACRPICCCSARTSAKRRRSFPPPTPMSRARAPRCSRAFNSPGRAALSAPPCTRCSFRSPRSIRSPRA